MSHLLASEKIHDFRDGRFWTRLRTNVDREMLLNRLEQLGLAEFVEAVDGILDPTHMHGGNAYRILWRAGVSPDTITSGCRSI